MAILTYIGRRLLVLIPVLLGISLAAFLLGRIAPGDPVDDALFRIGIEFPTEEDRAAMRAELGLDQSLPAQYLDWLNNVLHGDLGRSYIGNKDIASELLTRLPITLKVSLAAMLVAVVFGVGGGVLMAACHGTWLDTVLKGLSNEPPQGYIIIRTIEESVLIQSPQNPEGLLNGLRMLQLHSALKQQSLFHGHASEPLLQPVMLRLAHLHTIQGIEEAFPHSPTSMLGPPWLWE